jgi:hypothetical protein
MDLLSNMNEAQWTSSQPDKLKGLVDYTILKCKPLDAGRFEYALKVNKEDGDLIVGVLEGGQGKRNPLQAARNIEMIITAGKIVALNLDGDCVVRK